jgi:arsenate reductase-like glutaredoxin family protein
MTCTRAQEFLEQHAITAGTVVDARKQPLGKAEALKLAGEVDEIYAAKGTKMVHFDQRKQKPSAEDLLAVLLGPTGNLRAPTARIGRTLLVGFSQDMYKQITK